MAKIIDITEKLSLEKPQIKIGDVILTVNDEAMAMLEIMPLLDGDMNAETIDRICRTIFSDEDFEKIKSLKLSLKDFQILFKVTMSLVTGNDDEPGETATHATT